LDLTAYESYFAGKIKDVFMTDAEMTEAAKVFANHPKPQSLKSNR
jgi:hypothetical protein